MNTRAIFSSLLLFGSIMLIAGCADQLYPASLTGTDYGYHGRYPGHYGHQRHYRHHGYRGYYGHHGYFRHYGHH